MLRINTAHNDAVRVVCRDAIRKVQMPPQPFFLLFCKCFNLCPFIRIGQYCKKHDHDNAHQWVSDVRRMPVVRNGFRIFLTASIRAPFPSMRLTWMLFSSNKSCRASSFVDFLDMFPISPLFWRIYLILP